MGNTFRRGRADVLQSCNARMDRQTRIDIQIRWYRKCEQQERPVVTMVVAQS